MFLCHIGHTSLPNLLFNGAILYTIGNYHVLKYGNAHFLTLYGLGCLAGGIFAAYNARCNPQQKLSGGIAGTGALLGYNLFRNPMWFKYALNPLWYLPLFVLYSVFYNDRGALGGVSLGYAAFLFGLL